MSLGETDYSEALRSNDMCLRDPFLPSVLLEMVADIVNRPVIEINRASGHCLD